jgi:Uma2 family endonuclease
MGKSAARVATPAKVPPLRNGDRLTVEEFRRRYEASPHITKAELIRGVVYVVSSVGLNGREGMTSPVNHLSHGRPHLLLSAWLGHYYLMTPGTDAGDNSSLRLPQVRSEPQPDLFLRIHPDHGGQSGTDAEGYVEGAPELIAEVAASSASYDLHDKLELYRGQGVREYIVWRTEDRQIDWFTLGRRREYVPLAADAGGILKSRAFPGLWLDPAALLTEDRVTILAVVQRGLASPEHEAFVAKLRKAAGRKKRP